MAFCIHCGATIAEGAQFCAACGKTQAGQPAPASAPAASTGLEPNLAGALAYLWFTAILWLVIEPYNKDRFIRFHSFQAIGFGIVAFVVSMILGLIPILGWIVGIFWSIAVLLLWLVCIYKAFNKEMWKLPVIGDFAAKQAG